MIYTRCLRFYLNMRVAYCKRQAMDEKKRTGKCDLTLSKWASNILGVWKKKTHFQMKFGKLKNYENIDLLLVLFKCENSNFGTVPKKKNQNFRYNVGWKFHFHKNSFFSFYFLSYCFLYYKHIAINFHCKCWYRSRLLSFKRFFLFNRGSFFLFSCYLFYFFFVNISEKTYWNFYILLLRIIRKNFLREYCCIIICTS